MVSFKYSNQHMKFRFFESGQKPEINKEGKEITPRNMKKFGDKALELALKGFSVEGLEQLKEFKEKNPEKKFIISASHLHNLDLPAALSSLGDDFNIQITGESLLLEQLKYIDKRVLINSVWGRDNFTALDYVDKGKGKHGGFNPDNFTELEEKMEEGKTPWMAIHPFAADGKMKDPKIGAAYLAAKTGADIIPTALDIQGGGSDSMEGAVENLKGLLKRSEAIYRIGEPIELPPLDVSTIDKVLAKRKNGENISEGELEEFKKVHKELSERARLVSDNIAKLLPEEKREQ